MGNHTSIPTSSKHTMKIFLLFVGLMAKEAFCQKRITVDTRAPSTYQNCNCQCDSIMVTDGNELKGNCRSQDKNGVLFCYISGRALNACRDRQRSSFLPNSQLSRRSDLRYYSYEACTTPPRNQCSNNNNFGNQNLGDGDYQSNGGSNTYYPPTYLPGGSNSYRPGGSNSYRPGGSSSYRPASSNSYRPGGSSSNSYRPGGSGLNLGSILSGIRNKGTSGSSGSSDGGSSNGAINFEA